MNAGITLTCRTPRASRWRIKLADFAFLATALSRTRNLCVGYDGRMQLCQVVLFVHDASRMQAFYEQLGLVVIEGSAASGYLRLCDPAGGAVLALHYTPHVGPPTGPRTDTAIKFCFHVTDIETTRDALGDHGAQMRDIHRFDGMAICDGADPEGNIFQLTSR